MKRIISILTLIALLLCGCAATSSVKEPKALSELGEGKRAESIAIVKLTINPEFELYLDVNFNVTKVRCLNEDAVTALEAVQANLVGNNYGSAMFSILDAAAQTGFLVPEAQIKIETTLHTPMAEQDLEYMAQSMADPVEVYSENNGLNLSVEAVTPTVDEKAVEAFMKYFETNQPTADQSFVVNGNEASGNLYDENGTKIGTFLDIYDVYGPEGHLLKSERFYDDGTYSCDTFEYDANGNKTKWESATSDGWSMVETYFTNGNIKSNTTTTQDGSVYANAYYENGNLESSTTTMQDGSISTETYYENGNMHMSVYDGPNGEHTESYFAEDGTYAWNRGPANGTLTQTVYGNTVGTTTQYFDENGYLYKAVSEFADGSKDEITFYPNGNQRSALCLSPYGSSYMYYNEDGTLAENRGEPNSVIELGNVTKYYDENGALYKEVLIRQDGSVTEITYYPNGNKKSIYDNDPDNLGYWFFEEDGSAKPHNQGEPNLIAPITCYGPDGMKGICTRYFDENGLLYKDETIYQDGSAEEGTYYPSGRRKSIKSIDPNGVVYSYGYYSEGGTLLPDRGEPNLVVVGTCLGGDGQEGIFTTYFDGDGMRVKEVQEYPDGSSVEIYYSNGKTTKSIIRDNATGYYQEYYYDESGNPVW